MRKVDWWKSHSIKCAKMLSKKKQWRKMRGKLEYENNQKKHSANKNSIASHVIDNNINEKEPIIMAVPKIFSIEKNLEETAKFFCEFNDNVKQETKDSILVFLDLSNVTYIGAEAIMHLIGMMSEMQSRDYKIRIKGNLPKDEKNIQYLNDCGFFKYVNASVDVSRYTKSNEKIQIQWGQKVMSPIAKDLCCFAHEYGNFTQKETMPLYEMIVEMMTNTCYHAYEEPEKDYSSWYVFAEANGEEIKFAFLDTGLGIPTTINRKLYEKIIKPSDSKLLMSALEGDGNRSQTKEKNRGKGLPQIYENSRAPYFIETHILSGTAYCVITPNGVKEIKDIKNEMPGTLYSWRIRKENMK